MQLVQALLQKNVGGQHGNQVEAILQQADAQAARTLGLAQGVRVLRITDIQVGGDDNNAKGVRHGVVYARSAP